MALVGSPLKLSATPVEYHLPPPQLGEHTATVLAQRLGYTADDQRGCARPASSERRLPPARRSRCTRQTDRHRTCHAPPFPEAVGNKPCDEG